MKSNRVGSPRHTEPGRLRLAAPLAVAALAAVVYAPARHGGFIWDDPLIVHDVLPVLTSVSRLLAPPTDVVLLDRYYRPLTYASYWLDNYLGSGGALLFHLTGILAHALCSALVCVLAMRLHGTRGSVTAGVMAGALFAVHPIHVESIAWIVGRGDVLAGLFLLVMLWNLLRDGWLPVVLAGLSFFAALCAKENAVCGLPLAVLVVGLRPTGAATKTASGAALLAALAFYAALRHHALGAWIGPPTLTLHADAAWRAAAAVLFTLRTLLLPVPVCPFFGGVPTPTVTSWLAVLATAAALIAAWRAWRRGEVLPLIGVAWIGIAMLPNLAVATNAIATTPIAERYSYVPSIGACWFVGWLVATVRARGRWEERVALAASVALIGAGGIASVDRISIWQSNETFWTAAARCAPDHCFPLTQLADPDLLAGRAAAAERQYRTALAHECPASFRAYTLARLGLTEYQQGRLGEAEEHFGTARALDPKDAFAAFGVGLCAATQANAQTARDENASAQLDRAQAALEAAIALRQRYPDAHYLLGEVLRVQGDDARARAEFESVLHLEPEGDKATKARAALTQMAADDAAGHGD